MNTAARPKVSVCMLAYNNSEYVEQAIDCVLAQKTNFPIELVIGEDASTDDVATKIRKYTDTGNVQIRVRFNEKNVGLIKNLALTLSDCHGEYIAYLDNDDYWTDSCKLQKQVDFLDKNREFSICHHAVEFLRNGKLEQDPLTTMQSDISNVIDLAKGNFIRSCAAVFRAGDFDGFPEDYYRSTVNDYFLFMLVARNGLIKFMDESMAVYRIHEKSDWSTNPNQDIRILDYLECMIGNFDAKIDRLLIERHQNIAYKSFSKRLDEPGFTDRLMRCLKYGDERISAPLKEAVLWSDQCNKSYLLNRIRQILV